MDADQSLSSNTDIRELYDIDLGDAGYGFVPHCNIRDNYFGVDYWKDILESRNKKYHFGGIFVVDLQHFRTTASAAYLRFTYNRLVKSHE